MNKSVNLYQPVTVRFINECVEYKLVIVQPHERDLSRSLISSDSPLGKAILNSQTGQEIIFRNDAGGMVNCEIIAID